MFILYGLLTLCGNLCCRVGFWFHRRVPNRTK